ncbi:MAG: hypothetical protein ACTSUE_00790 [Promethearchaeota archaeon]
MSTNLRSERFIRTVYDFDPNNSKCLLATTPGPLASPGNFASLTSEGVLELKLKSETKGMFWDGVTRVLANGIASGKQDQERMDVGNILEMAILIQDNRAVRIHGYEKSPEEKACPPDRSAQVSLEEWIAVYHRAMGTN